MTRVLDQDEETGKIELFHYDESTDRVTIETITDVTDIVEANKALFNEHTSLDRYGDMTRVASIPMSLYFDLKAKGIVGDDEKMKAWLNNPDNRFFRTRPGKV